MRIGYVAIMISVVALPALPACAQQDPCAGLERLAKDAGESWFKWAGIVLDAATKTYSAEKDFHSANLQADNHNCWERGNNDPSCPELRGNYEARLVELRRLKQYEMEVMSGREHASKMFEEAFSAANKCKETRGASLKPPPKQDIASDQLPFQLNPFPLQPPADSEPNPFGSSGAPPSAASVTMVVPATGVLTTVPAGGVLKPGQRVLVDDKTCKPGYIREVTGGTRGDQLQTRCVPRETATGPVGNYFALRPHTLLL